MMAMSNNTVFDFALISRAKASLLITLTIHNYIYVLSYLNMRAKLVKSYSVREHIALSLWWVFLLYLARSEN